MFGLCRKIPDDTARLKCFDTIVPAPQKTDQPKAVQEWSIEDSKSLVDNSPEVFATLTSEDGRSELIKRYLRSLVHSSIVEISSLFRPSQRTYRDSATALLPFSSFI